MSKLVIFGDSFAHKVIIKNQSNSEIVWYELLAKKLDQDLQHYGLSGSSIEYSISKIYEYINSSNYSENDIIIFVCTSLSRSPIVHKDIPPNIASHWINFIHRGLEFNKDKNLEHYENHSDFYKTLFKFFNYQMAYYQKLHMALLLKTLPNMALIISAFDDVDQGLVESRKTLISSDENFLLINTSLYEISKNEYVSGVEYADFHTFFNGEVRNAHLSKSNNLVLCDQLYNCITYKTDKYFDKNKFNKNFIKLELTTESKKIFDDEFLSSWKDGIKDKI